jgi:hypothetical protein
MFIGDFCVVGVLFFKALMMSMGTSVGTSSVQTTTREDEHGMDKFIFFHDFCSFFQQHRPQPSQQQQPRQQQQVSNFYPHFLDFLDIFVLFLQLFQPRRLQQQPRSQRRVIYLF